MKTRGARQSAASLGTAFALAAWPTHAHAQLEPFVERVPGVWTALSADGEVAASSGRRWVHGQGIEFLPRACASCEPLATDSAISWDGNVIAFTCTYPSIQQTGVRWTRADGTRALQAISGGLVTFSANSMSATGEFIAGRARLPSGSLVPMMRWSAASGAQTISDSQETGIDPFFMSYDGSTIVGTVRGGRGAVWTASGFELIPPLPGSISSAVAMACSADGSRVVGYSSTGSGMMPFLWTRAASTTPLPLLTGGSAHARASAISADGRLIAGEVTYAGSRQAFVFDAHHGMRLLQDVYREQTGIDPGVLLRARAISPDGRTFAGDGFILRLRAPCAGDVDDGSMSGGRDGTVNPDDLTAFLEWMSTGDLRADLDDGSGTGRPDAAISIDDLLYFLRGYVDGC